MSLTIGSLFSGIGGLELGLERAGLGPVIWQAEVDPFCRRVLAKHWPDVKRYGDVRDIDATAERPDIICGGFPCQDISVAGKGAGLEGERSGLWFEYARIVRDLRPRIVVVENVTALLGRGLGVVLGDLAALGYDALWDCIPAAAVGAPHRRDRVFVVARLADSTRKPGYDDGAESGGGRAEQREVGGSGGAVPVADADIGRGGERIEGRGSEGGAVARWDGAGDVADAERAGPQGCPGRGVRGEGRSSSESFRVSAWPPAPNDLHAWGRVPADTQPAVCRLADGVSARLAGRSAKLKALGNAVVPAVAEVIGAAVREVSHG